MFIKQIIAAVACMLLALNVANAAYKGSKDRVCADDAKKFCSSVKPGEGRVYQCLMGHSGEINPACRDQLTAAKAAYDKFEQACGADAEKYCKGVPPGRGRVLSCLKGRESDLSPSCRDEYSKAKGNKAIAQ